MQVLTNMAIQSQIWFLIGYLAAKQIVSCQVRVIWKVCHTWKTVTMAQMKESKFDLEVMPLNVNLPPKRFMPRMAKVNMKRNNRAKNVITLDMVLIMTIIWCLIGRTSLNILSRRRLRRTITLLPRLRRLFVSNSVTLEKDKLKIISMREFIKLWQKEISHKTMSNTTWSIGMPDDKGESD